jgi:hypothetical protein
LNIAAFAYGYGRITTTVADLKEVETKWEALVNQRFDRVQTDIREIRSLFLKANGGISGK